MTDDERTTGVPSESDSEEPIGIFPTWRSLYATILVYTFLTVIVLYAFTVMFDRSAS